MRLNTVFYLIYALQGLIPASLEFRRLPNDFPDPQHHIAVVPARPHSERPPDPASGQQWHHRAVAPVLCLPTVLLRPRPVELLQEPVW